MAKTTKAINVSIGASLKELEQAMRDAGILVEDFSVKTKKAGATGAAGFNELEKGLKGFKREQVQEGRLVGFYVKELTSFAGASSGTQAAMGGLIQGMVGLATATGPLLVVWAGFEIFKGLATYFNEVGEAAEKAALQAAAAVGKLADRLAELRAAREGTKPVDVEQGKLDAAKRLARAQIETEAATSTGDTDREDVAKAQLEALNKEIAAWEKINGPLRTYIIQQSQLVAGMRDATAASVALNVAESARVGNLEMEMGASGDAVGVAAAKLETVRAGFEKMGITAQVAMAKARGASAEEIATLADKAEMVTLMSQLTNAASSAEIDAINKRIQALKLEATIRRNMKAMEGAPVFGPGNAAGEKGFEFDKADLAATQKQNEKDAQSYDAANFDLSGISASQAAADKSKKDAKEVQDAWGAAGDGISAAFGAVGTAIAGNTGAIIGQIAQVAILIVKFIALAIAAAASSEAQKPFIGAFAAVAGAIAVAAALGSLIGGLADGGPMEAGRPYMVGERGPELVVPNQSGTVVPNHQLGRGGGVTVNITTPDARSFERMLRRNDNALVRVLREATASGRY